MRFKSWPLWDDWKFVFGKDRASGDVSQDSYDAYDVFASQDQLDSRNKGLQSNAGAGTEEYAHNIPSPRHVSHETPDESTGQSINASQESNKQGKKRKASSDSPGLIETLNKMQEDTNLRLDKLTSRIGFEFDVSKSRKEVFAIVGAIPELTLLQQIDVAEIILDKVERIELFLCLPETGRLTYVMRALQKHGYV